MVAMCEGCQVPPEVTAPTKHAARARGGDNDVAILHLSPSLLPPSSLLLQSHPSPPYTQLQTMKFLSLLLLPALALASNVIDLDDKNFENHVGGAKGALVEFFAPWSVHR